MKILIVDDEKNVRRIIGDFLRSDGYEIIEAENGEKALETLYETPRIELVLLDIRMPKMDGFECLKEMRRFSDVPVIMITALNDSYDEIKGLELGAADYITKPFRYEVLLARVKACLRQSGAKKADIIQLGALSLNTIDKHAVLDGAPLILTQKEYELLEYLARNRGMTLTREKILDAVWGYDCNSDPRTLDTHIKNLRRKLDESSNMIITVRGVGYKIVY